MSKNPDILIIGAGPAGLAAAHELTRRGHRVLCLEKDSQVGGISRTLQHNGYRFDIGGHRFFTKIDRVNDLWESVLKEDFLRRNRLSRIYYNNRFFDYPLKPFNALKGLGLKRSIELFLSYLESKARPYPQEETFEQWVGNRFGKKLYETFFKTYTEKVWGIPCNEIAASWAAQRIKGMSMASVIKTALFGNRGNKIKSLIDQFDYPKFGPGQMYESMADQVVEMGSEVWLNCSVEKFHISGNKITAIDVIHNNGRRETLLPQQVVSSMPVTELIHKISNHTEQQSLYQFSTTEDTEEDREAVQPNSSANSVSSSEAGGKKVPPTDDADQLSYRSLLTINLMFDTPGTLPDTWLYIHSPEVRVGRIQSFHNWSPHMVPSDRTSSLGMEYFCNEHDNLWCQPDTDLIQLAKAEITHLQLADTQRITDAFVYRCPKAYPVYDSTFAKHLKKIKRYLNTIHNLQCIGRNGMFKYNNMDHSILSGLLAADNLCERKYNLWNVNTDQHYQEEEQRTAECAGV